MDYTRRYSSGCEVTSEIRTTERSTLENGGRESSRASGPKTCDSYREHARIHGRVLSKGAAYLSVAQLNNYWVVGPCPDDEVKRGCPLSPNAKCSKFVKFIETKVAVLLVLCAMYGGEVV
ncbi:hypothetical protein C0Q70_00725 [Pomacea canaliculata]|uniref:Uncharacterized protein n=1 Tax=Pomacea canaliculata TaxID=400727 RepID=A0A2T7PXG9_POMCA|nr:hypothetical protein C0Q70_00725 [Pomacea canaliculata]